MMILIYKKTGCIYAIQLVWNALDVENQKNKRE